MNYDFNERNTGRIAINHLWVNIELTSQFSSWRHFSIEPAAKSLKKNLGRLFSFRAKFFIGRRISVSVSGSVSVFFKVWVFGG